MRIGRDFGHAQSHIGSKVLSASKSIKPMETRDKEVAILLADEDGLQIELFYCSIYDECWLVERANAPSPVAQCAIDDKLRFLQ